MLQKISHIGICSSVVLGLSLDQDVLEATLGIVTQFAARPTQWSYDPSVWDSVVLVLMTSPCNCHTVSFS
jgi:hypothetical protein